MPVDKQALAMMWRDVLAQATQMPAEVLGDFDFAKIFSYMAKLGGLTEIDQFKKTDPQAVPSPQLEIQGEEEIAGQVQAGNLIPLSEAASE